MEASVSDQPPIEAEVEQPVEEAPVEVDPTPATPAPVEESTTPEPAVESVSAPAEPAGDAAPPDVIVGVSPVTEQDLEQLHVGSAPPAAHPPGWVENPPILGSTGFASGGGDIVAGSPALTHSLNPIPSEGDHALMPPVAPGAAPEDTTHNISHPNRP